MSKPQKSSRAAPQPQKLPDRAPKASKWPQKAKYQKFRNAQKRVFWGKKSQKFDKMVLSWPREMVDSLKNQKKIVWNDREKMFLNQKTIGPK